MQRKSFLVFFSLTLLLFTQCRNDEGSCEGKACRSFQICDDGRCRCNDGFTGEQCETQISPIAVLITKIEVTKIPSQTVTGRDWDNNSFPDLYITIFQSFNPIWTIDKTLEDQDPSRSLTIDLSGSPIRLNDHEERHTITMYDDDGRRTDEFMAGVLFTPYNNTNRFPTEIEINSNPIVSYRLTLEYIYR